MSYLTVYEGAAKYLWNIELKDIVILVQIFFEIKIWFHPTYFP